MSDETVMLSKPPSRVSALLDNELVEVARKYGVSILLVWQLVGGGIKTTFENTIRDVLRQELNPLEKRIAALEKDLAK